MKKSFILPTTFLEKNKVDKRDGTAIYAQLRQTVTEAGILDRAYRFYAILITLVLASFFFSAYQIYVTQAIIPLIGWCIVFSFFTMQVTGLLHDSGHRAIFATVKMNNFFGHIFGTLVSGSFHAWNTRHNTHHASPNVIEDDMDIEIPVVSFTTDEYLSKKGAAKFLRKYQVYLFYPMMLMVNIVLRSDGFGYFYKTRSWASLWQLIVYLAAIAVWFISPFVVFDFPKAIVVVLVVNFLLGFYMMNIFAPNHKAMPQLRSRGKLSFLEHQIVTSRNIKGNWLTDFIFMGLNYQIEHHLFPNCPRNKLKYIQPYVMEICRKLKLEYSEVNALETNQVILADLSHITRTSEKLLAKRNRTRLS